MHASLASFSLRCSMGSKTWDYPRQTSQEQASRTSYGHMGHSLCLSNRVTVYQDHLIPHCICTPAHSLHPPTLDKPVRIQIEGPLVSIQKLLPEVPWHIDVYNRIFPQPAGPELAKLAYLAIYGKDASLSVDNDMIVQDEYLGWVHEKK